MTVDQEIEAARKLAGVRLGITNWTASREVKNPIGLTLELVVLTPDAIPNMEALTRLLEYPGGVILYLANERSKLAQQVVDLMEELNKAKGL